MNLLDDIQGPRDLDRLDDAQITQLCGELREVIVDTVRRTGGHLGSNLGAVELTVAIHRVYDSPNDIVLWDTGHQAYVHKLLTGRRGDFHQLRQTGGMSGYPSRSESPHDWIENSHASTVLSYAHGLATAEELRRTQRRRRKVVAVLGDGAMTGGMAYEGLNNLGHSGRDCVIVLNDNGRSYAPTASRLGESLARLRGNPRFRHHKARAGEVVLEHAPFPEWVEKGVVAAKAAVRELLEPPAFFEDLGVHYLGPFDGHDVPIIEEALRNADSIDGPVVVHLLTQKGRGYAPAENDPIKAMHDVGALVSPPAPKAPSYTDAFTEALIKLGEEHPEIVAVTAAMPDSTGVMHFADRFPERTLDVGIAEQHAVTAAAGMAMGGLRPFVAVYATFLTRAFDQVNLDVGLHGQPVVFCLDRAGITGADGPSHHGVIDMMLLTKVPGMTVFAPSSYQDLQVMMADALEISDGPVAIRWPKTPARVVDEHDVGSGRSARRLRNGDDICFVAVGKMVDMALVAAERLENAGHSVTIWDPRCVSHPDPEMIADAARHSILVTAEDGIRSGGVGMAIADRVRRSATAAGGRSPTERVLGVPDRYLPHGGVDAILAEVGLDAAGLEQAALDAVAVRAALAER